MPLCYGVPHVLVILAGQRRTYSQDQQKERKVSRRLDVKAHVSETMAKDISEKDNLTMKTEY